MKIQWYYQYTRSTLNELTKKEWIMKKRVAERCLHHKKLRSPKPTKKKMRGAFHKMIILGTKTNFNYFLPWTPIRYNKNPIKLSFSPKVIQKISVKTKTQFKYQKLLDIIFNFSWKLKAKKNPNRTLFLGRKSLKSKYIDLFHGRINQFQLIIFFVRKLKIEL